MGYRGIFVAFPEFIPKPEQHDRNEENETEIAGFQDFKPGLPQLLYHPSGGISLPDVESPVMPAQ
jgi:hypothetical protein